MLDDSELDGDPAVERLLSAASRILKKYDCKAAVKEFRPFDIPVLYTINEKAYESRQIKRSKENANDVFSDMLTSFENELGSDAKACLYFNTNNLIIRKLIDNDDREKIECYIEILYVQSLLSGHFPLLNNELKTLNENLYKLMEF